MIILFGAREVAVFLLDYLVERELSLMKNDSAGSSPAPAYLRTYQTTKPKIPLITSCRRSILRGSHLRPRDDEFPPKSKLRRLTITCNNLSKDPPVICTSFLTQYTLATRNNLSIFLTNNFLLCGSHHTINNGAGKIRCHGFPP